MAIGEMYGRLGAVIGALVILSGCAVTPMTAELRLDTGIASSDIGVGKSVSLQVFDQREVQRIGNRGGSGFSGATIRLDQDLVAVVQDAAAEMLSRKGFDVKLSGNEEATLRIDIRGLQYSTSTGFWTGGIHMTAAIRAEGRNALTSFENFYRFESEDRVVIVPGAAANNERINAALNDVLHQLFRDQKMLEVLAGS